MTFDRSPRSEKILHLHLLVIGYVFIYSHLSWWFGSKPVDMTRHQLASAIALRILAVVSLLFLLSTIFEFLHRKYRLIRSRVK